jgi:hypothetical protein
MATGTQHKLVTTTVPRCMACSLLRLVLGIGTLLGRTDDCLAAYMRFISAPFWRAGFVRPDTTMQPHAVNCPAHLLPPLTTGPSTDDCNAPT